jgi:ribonuclease E
VIVHAEPIERKGGAAQPATGPDEERPARGKRSRKPKASAPEPVEAVSPVDAEKRRAAASAIAAIAAATAHHDEDWLGEAALPDEVAQVDAAGEVVVGQAVEAAIDAVVEAEPPHRVTTPDEPGQSAPPTADARDTADTVDAASVPATRPRRRRAASRPAGPPVASSAASQAG